MKKILYLLFFVCLFEIYFAFKRLKKPIHKQKTNSIGIICPYDLSVHGGVQKQVIGLANEYSKYTESVIIIAPGSIPQNIKIQQNVTIKTIGSTINIKANGSIAPICINLMSSYEVYKILADVDVVHIHEPFAPVLSWILLLCIGKKKIIATFHRYSDSFYDIFASPFTRFMSRAIDVCVAVSPEAFKTSHVLTASHPLIIPNGITIRPFNYKREIQPKIVFIGRHEKRKGLEVLLRAHEMIEEHICLEIIGKGVQTDLLMKNYPETNNRKWKGVVSDEIRDHTLNTCCIFCVPSLGGESFGIVLLEAMICGASVIASDIPGYNSVCPNDVTRIVTPNNPIELSQKLMEDFLEFTYNRNKWDEKRMKAYNYACTFDMGIIAKKYLQLM